MSVSLLSASLHGCKLVRHSYNIFSADLYFCLATGEKPRFFTDPVSWSSIFTNPDCSSDYAGGHDRPHHLQSVHGLVDTRLAIVFADLQYFARLINRTIDSRRRMQGTEYQNAICSIQHRLLALQGALDAKLDECLRLAALAFLSTMFALRPPGNGKRAASFPYLENRFFECCRALESTATPQARQLMLWLLAIGAISICGAEEQWLCERWRADVSGLAWPEARRRLQEILWIDAIYDELGKSVFEKMEHPMTS